MTTDPAPRSWDSPRAAPSVSASVLDAVRDLRRDVAATELLLDVPGADAGRARRTQVLDQLDDHLLPRLRAMSAPAVVVVAGSTGAGKSTLVNSVVGREVSAAGLLRPTTRKPVLVHHPADEELLAGHPLLEVVVVAADEAVPRGIALVDAPDLDSVLVDNRTIAHRLLESADLWLFVTTAARYGDALPWEVLGEAAQRGTSIAMVLNRVPPPAMGEVRSDLLGRLRDRAMTSVPLFVIPDQGPHEGPLDPPLVAPVRRWLAMVAGPDRARSVILRTQRGALRALRPWVDELAEAVQAQVDARHAIEALVDQAQAGPVEALTRSVRSGAVVDGPVRGRWQALVREGVLRSWSGRRGRAARVAALDTLDRELTGSLRLVLAGARRRGGASVAHALERSDLPGAHGVLAALDDPAVRTAATSGVLVAPDADQSAADWLLAARGAARRAVDGRPGGGRKAARDAADLGDDGLGTLLALAAGGLGSARAVTTTLLGEAADGVLAAVTDDLAERAAEQVRAGAGPARAVLQVEALADDAASRLRLRLAVLKDVA